MIKQRIAQLGIYAIALALPLLLATACEKNQFKSPTVKTSGETAGDARLSVRMHDTIGPYSQVNVEIIDASVHVSDSNGEQWMPLNVNAGVYDLLVLQNGVDTILANATSISPGYVSQLRLILGDSNWIVMNDSVTTHPLETPSAQQSGLKININDSLQPLTTYEIVLDFDADRSVVERGNGTYLLKPVIKVDTLMEI